MFRGDIMKRWALALMVTAVAATWALCCAQGTRPLHAQEALPTLVITQPTATPTPAPSPAETRLGYDTATAYLVQPGDTLLKVALEMGVDLDAMGCLMRPDFDATQPLVIGDALQPLPDGILCHHVKAGETLFGVAGHYGVQPAAILGEAWNALPSLAADSDLGLVGGRYLRVPLPLATSFDAVTIVGQPNGDTPFLTWMLGQAANTAPQEALQRGLARTSDVSGPVPANWPYGSGRFLWPAYGLLTQAYRFDHRAVDIAAPLGSPVTASDRGVVLRAGWNNQGYGRFVIIDHKIDYLTLYAHLDTIFVREGEIVAPGQVLGTVGATGNATGPHLHFEIRDFGRIVNPLELLTN
jgi:hypothetical protein